MGWALAEVKGALLQLSATRAATTTLGADMAARQVFDNFREVGFKVRPPALAGCPNRHAAALARCVSTHRPYTHARTHT